MLEKTIQNLELPIIQEYQETHPDEDAKVRTVLSSGVMINANNHREKDNTHLFWDRSKQMRTYEHHAASSFH
jgi:hypothetical protein